MKRFLIFFLFGVGGITSLQAQSAYLPYNRAYYHLLERYEIKKGDFNPHFNTGFKPYRRDYIATYVDSLTLFQHRVNLVGRFNLNYLRDDNWEFSSFESRKSLTSVWGIYRKPSDFYHHRNEVFDFHLNPVVSFIYGNERGEDNFRFRNTRGLDMRGSIDGKIGFYTFLAMNEVRFPSWVDEYTHYNGAVPGEGFWKPYGDEGYSYFSAMGHITFPITEHIQVQLGHDRNFVGEGYRSLILSDFSNPFMFLKLNTRIWKFDFNNLWGQMTADLVYNRGRPTDARYPQKWFSHHRLGINLTSKFNIAVFESTMANTWDWNYTNPVIFYRWVEHSLGTPDKVMLGLDFKWNFVSSMQLYGQFVLDEFVWNEFFRIEGINSRRNKHGLQLGYKYIDVFGVSNLDVQMEYNQVRPYTYQEKFAYTSFTNYRTPLTHPRGANFREALGILRYQPITRLHFDFTGIYQSFGTDPAPDINFGGDISKNHGVINTGMGLYGHSIGQGVPNRIIIVSMNGSYMLRHNMFFDINHIYRNQLQSRVTYRSTNFIGVGLRLNFARQDYLF